MSKGKILATLVFLIIGWEAVLLLDLGVVEPIVHWLILIATIIFVYLAIFVKLPHGKYRPEGIERLFMWAAPITALSASVIGFTAKMQWLPEVAPMLTSWPVILSSAPLGIIMLLLVFSEEIFGGNMNFKLFGFSLVLAAGWAAIIWLDLGIVEPVLLWLVLTLTILVVYFRFMPDDQGPFQRPYLLAFPIATLIATVAGTLFWLGVLPGFNPVLSSSPVILSAAAAFIVTGIMLWVSGNDLEFLNHH